MLRRFCASLAFISAVGSRTKLTIVMEVFFLQSGAQAKRNETMRRTDPISGYSYNTRGSGRAKWIVLLVLILAVIAALLIFHPWVGDEDNPSSGTNPLPDGPNPPGGGLIIDSSAGEYVAPTVDSKIEPNVAIPGWGRITIPSGSQEITSVDFYNPEENAGLYYLTFELRLPTDDGGYISLYRSDAIPPGKHVQRITLSQPLDAGTYEAVVHVQPYRMSDETPTNNANMKTTLVVV